MPRILIAIAAVVLSGCATSPLGPTTVVMPAPGKPFEVFAQDQSMCKQYAGSEVDGGATTANLKEFGTAAITTALGAGLGAAIHGGRGAEIGGGAGALGGAALAANGSARDQNTLQGRYNVAYTQCMYARGNQVAGAPHSTPRVASGNGGQGYGPVSSTPPDPRGIH
jgi:hypothetical protein